MAEPQHIIVTRPLSNPEYAEIRAMKNAMIFSSQKLELTGYRYIPEDPEMQARSIRNSFDYILRLGHKNLHGKKIIDLLSVNGDTYWYYLRFTLYTWLFPIMQEKDTIDGIIKNNHLSSEPTIFSNHRHSFGGSYRLPQKAGKVSKTKLIIKFLYLFFVRYIIGLWQHFRVGKNKHIVLLEPYNLHRILDINQVRNRGFVTGDFYNEYLTDLALKQDDFAFITDYYIPKFDHDFRLSKLLFKNKYSKKSLYFEFYLGQKLLNPFFLLRLYRFRKALKTNLSALESDDFDENRVFKTIRSKINLLTLMYARERICARLVQRKKIKSITCHHEQAYHHYSLIRGAGKSGIATNGFQHGVVHGLHMHYMFLEEDWAYNPIPDHMIMWGEHWKKILVEKASYDPNRLPVLGQIRTDIIPALKNFPKRSPHITLMFASQAHHRVEFQQKMAEDIFHVAALHPDMKVVIKPHPGEKNPKDFFGKIARKVGIDNWELSMDDLYITLNDCDLLITHNSTVGAEAIYFNKPVIIFDYEDTDVSGYTKYEGAVFKVKNQDGLDAVVKAYKNKTLIMSEQVQQDFIRTFCYTIDGQTCKRYIDFIRQHSK